MPSREASERAPGGGAGAREHGLAAGVLALSVLVYGWEWWVGGRLPPGDFAGYAAQMQWVRDTLLEHARVPRWCLECYGGTATFGSALKERLFFPLALVFEPVYATQLAHGVLRFAAGLGSYALFCRVLAAPLPALVAAHVYVFGAVANHQNPHLDIALSAALLPWIVFVSIDWLRHGGAGRAIVLAALVAAHFVNHWVHALSAFLAIAGLLALRPWRGDGEPAALLRTLIERRAAIALAAGLFTALSLSQLAWLLADGANHRLMPAESIAELRSYLIERSPFLFVNRADVLAPWLAEHQPEGWNLSVSDAGRRYLGVVVLAVCAFGAFALRRESGLRRWAALAAAVFGIHYWLALGPRTLLWIVGESFALSPEAQAAWRSGMLACAGVCALAGGARIAFRRSGRGLLLAAGLLVAPVVSLWALAAWLLPLLEFQRSPGHFFDLAPFWLALLFAASLEALRRRIADPRWGRGLVILVAAATVVDFWPSRSAFADGVSLDTLRPTTAMLADLPGEDGTLRLGVPTDRYSPYWSWLAGHAPAGHAWGWLSWQAGRHWGRLAGEDAAQVVPGVPATPHLRAARVRYFLRARRMDPLPSPWQQRASGEHFTVWELDEVAPLAAAYRAYAALEREPSRSSPLLAGALAKRALLIAPAPGREAALREQRAADFEIPARVLVDPAQPAAPPPLEVVYERPRPERVVLEVDAGPAPAIVLFAESHHPWWRAEVDGRDVPVLRAQLALMAVPVGAGPQRVELRFEPPWPVAMADALGRVAWGALPIAGIVALVRRRRLSAGARPERATGNPDR